MIISGYSISDYILMVVILLAIGGYWWILMVINGYYISGYWWIFY
jgi:hypothetical protein